MTTEIKQRFK